MAFNNVPPKKMESIGEKQYQASASSSVDLKVGDPVEALWKMGRKWYASKIMHINEDGTFHLRYEDGDEWEKVPVENIRRMNGSPLFHKKPESPKKDKDCAEHSLASHRLVDWNDGHRPKGAPAGSTKMAILNRCAKGIFSVFDNVLPRESCSTIYEQAVSKSGKPWGVYITLEEAMNSDDDDCTPEKLAAMKDEESKQRAMAKCAVKYLYLRRAGGAISADWSKIHGVAVWCLSSGVGSQVEYHIDYAELFRYETNIIYPPLYAGTLQLTPIEDGGMIGGMFAANMRGLDHYSEYGYKCRLKKATQASDDDIKNSLASESLSYQADDDFYGCPVTSDKNGILDYDSSAWIKVPYRCNRGIVHDGDFPHLSTKIETLSSHLRRVILGFNLFSHEVGPAAQRAPEHSDKFNATVKLYQTMAAVRGSETKDKVTLSDLKKNKGLYRLLKLVAKKMKDNGLSTETLSAPPSTLQNHGNSTEEPSRVEMATD